MDNIQSPESKSRLKNFVQALVTAVASIFLAFLLPAIPSIIRGLHNTSSEKATGLAAMAGGLMEAGFSPWFWISFLICFSWFYLAGRVNRPMLRQALFWVPAVTISVLGLGFWIGFALLLSRVQMR